MQPSAAGGALIVFLSHTGNCLLPAKRLPTGQLTLTDAIFPSLYLLAQPNSLNAAVVLFCAIFGLTLDIEPRPVPVLFGALGLNKDVPLSLPPDDGLTLVFWNNVRLKPDGLQKQLPAAKYRACLLYSVCVCESVCVCVLCCRVSQLYMTYPSTSGSFRGGERAAL